MREERTQLQDTVEELTQARDRCGDWGLETGTGDWMHSTGISRLVGS